jgi:hypothetical protein
MSSTIITRMKGQNGPRLPMLGTFGSAANQYFAKGTIVQRDAAGRAVSPITADASGFPAMGVADAHLDNRTSSELGGAADAGNVEVTYGVKGLDYTGTAPLPCEVVYVVDNQTVSTDSNGGLRGIAGVCVEQRDGLAYVLMGPDVVSLLVAGRAPMSVPLNAFTASDGTPLAKFASASTPTFGLNLADSEALNIRWNNDPTPGTIRTTVSLPDDLDGSDLVLEFLCSKSGATSGDATTLTIAAFIIGTGDLHDADADAGGVTGAMTGAAAAKTTALLTRTIAGADIPATARLLNVSVTPTAGTLGTDDLMLHEVRVRKA